jgi:hypothetical protein
MKLENYGRLCGLAALLAGVLLFISEFLRLYLDYIEPGAYTSIFRLDAWAGALLGVLVQLGLIGLYAPQAKHTGVLGALGFFVAFVGAWLTTGDSFVDAYDKPSLWVPELLSGEEIEEFWGPLALFASTFALGWILFGVATLRAGIYPRAAAALLIAGTLVLILPLPLGGVIFSVAVAWMGYFLFSGSSEEAVRRSPAS